MLIETTFVEKLWDQHIKTDNIPVGFSKFAMKNNLIPWNLKDKIKTKSFLERALSKNDFLFILSFKFQGIKLFFIANFEKPTQTLYMC